MSKNITNLILSIEVKTPDGYKILGTKSILYVEAVRKCSIVHLNNNDIIITYHLLKWYDQHLLKPYFFRCHNSYLVNCQFIDTYSRTEIILESKTRIPLSKRNNGAFKINLQDFIKQLSE